MIPTQYTDAMVQCKKVFRSRDEALAAIMYAADRIKGEWGTSMIPDIEQIWAIMDESANFVDGAPAIKARFGRVVFEAVLSMMWAMTPDTMPVDPVVPVVPVEPPDNAAHNPWFDGSIVPVEGCDGPSSLSDKGLRIGGYVGPTGQENIQLWGAKKEGDWVKVYAASPRSANVGWCYWAAWTKGF